MKKVRLIYNPRSGDGRVPAHLDDIVSIYQRKGYRVEPFRLEFDYEDEEVVEGLDDSYDHIIVSGGDGTVNYMVNVLKNNNIDLPLAVIPAGTANDFAKMAGMPADVNAACKAILSGEVREVDLGMVNDKYFVNVFSCGLFTDVSQKTPTRMKNTFGKVAYYFSGMQELPNFSKMYIKVLSGDKEVYSGSSLVFFVFNGQTAGNLRIAYLSDISDGLLDLMILPGENIAEAIRAAMHYVRPSAGKYPKEIVHVRSADITVTSLADESTDIDGQPGPSLPVHIKCVHKGLKVIFPRGKAKVFLSSSSV